MFAWLGIVFLFLGAPSRACDSCTGIHDAFATHLRESERIFLGVVEGFHGEQTAVVRVVESLRGDRKPGQRVPKPMPRFDGFVGHSFLFSGKSGRVSPFDALSTEFEDEARYLLEPESRVLPLGEAVRRVGSVSNEARAASRARVMDDHEAARPLLLAELAALERAWLEEPGTFFAAHRHASLLEVLLLESPEGSGDVLLQGVGRLVERGREEPESFAAAQRPTPSGEMIRLSLAATHDTPVLRDATSGRVAGWLETAGGGGLSDLVYGAVAAGVAQPDAMEALMERRPDQREFIARGLLLSTGELLHQGREDAARNALDTAERLTRHQATRQSVNLFRRRLSPPR